MATSSLREYVKRYTQFDLALDALKAKKLRLPKPSTWEDLNDREFVELYRRRVAAKSVYALCCTMGTERFHHWWIFAKGSAGICLEFKRRPLQAALNKIPNVTARPMKYVPMNELNGANGYRQKDLPFIKRLGYKDEHEWRVLATSDRNTKLFDVPFDPDWLHRIVLSPWMSTGEADTVRKALKPLIPASAEISRSFLTNSKRWKNLGRALGR